MRKADVREARRHLNELLDEVRCGREVVITERGRPIARLAPIAPARAFPDLAHVRSEFRRLAPTLSEAVLEQRSDRFI